MDLLMLVDAAIIGAIMGIMEVIKVADKGKKLVRFYPLFVGVLGLGAALAKTQPFAWQQCGYNVLLYVGASSYIFKFGKTTLLGK